MEISENNSYNSKIKTWMTVKVSEHSFLNKANLDGLSRVLLTFRKKIFFLLSVSGKELLWSRILRLSHSSEAGIVKALLKLRKFQNNTYRWHKFEQGLHSATPGKIRVINVTLMLSRHQPLHDLTSNSNISKRVRVNIALTGTFFWSTW